MNEEIEKMKKELKSEIISVIFYGVLMWTAGFAWGKFT